MGGAITVVLGEEFQTGMKRLANNNFLVFSFVCGIEILRSIYSCKQRSMFRMQMQTKSYVQNADANTDICSECECKQKDVFIMQISTKINVQNADANKELYVQNADANKNLCSECRCKQLKINVQRTDANTDSCSKCICKQRFMFRMHMQTKIHVQNADAKTDSCSECRCKQRFMFRIQMQTQIHVQNADANEDSCSECIQIKRALLNCDNVEKRKKQIKIIIIIRSKRLIRGLHRSTASKTKC